ncbi:MAG TPA: PAS domain S-box protein [Steroidobacteraceae bacterium]|nr:PAS domain S-box protein [Steroidobacteraceae bacterium]
MSHAAAIALLRSFTRSLALVGAGLVLLTLVLAASHYRVERDRALVQARTATLQQAARLGALVTPFVQHTERMRAFMQQGLERGFDTPPPELCDRLYTVPIGGNEFGGTFLRDPVGAQEPPYGVVAASNLVERRGLYRDGRGCRADPELATALRLLEDLRIDHASNPALTRSYYNSAKLDLATSYPAYPLEQTRASALARNVRSADELLIARPAGSMFMRLGPEQNPGRARVWSEAYVDRGGAGTMVTLAKPVYASAPGTGEIYYGAVGTDLPLRAVTGFLQQLPLPLGRIYVLTPEGDVIGSSAALPEYEVQRLADLVPASLAAEIEAASPGSTLSTGADASPGATGSVASAGHRALVSGVEGTPWRLVYVATDADIVGAVAPSLLAYGGALLALLVVAVAGLWSFRRRFLQPAVAIFESTQGDEALLVSGTRSTPWQPIADVVAQTREANRLALERIDAQGRLKQAVFEASLDCIVTADEHGRILDCNPAAERVFGYPRAQLVGRPMTETIVPHRYRREHEAGMERYVATGRRSVLGRRIEIEGLRANGETFPLELAIAEAGVGSTRVFVAFIRDLTDRKAVEAEVQRQRDALYQKEKMAALGSMLAGVSHELNNPLAVVVGRASMLEEDVLEPQVKDSVRRLRAAAERCGRIVKTFLAMARQSKPQRQPVQVAQVLDGALEIAGYGLRSTGIEVHREYANALPQLLADQDQLSQVFMNLVVNAQHAMERKPGPRRLTVRTRLARAQDKAEVVVEFVDTGVGITEEVRKRIFEPFFTTKKQGEGTGLGLPVSLGMVEAHGGRIEIDSTVGVGSTLRVCLPIDGDVAAAESPPDTARAHPSPVSPPRQAPRHRALIVDEEEEVAAMLVEVLGADGFECTWLDNAAGALELLEREDFDVILSDLRMPGMNGHDFAVALAAQQPRLVERLVIVTGDTLGELRRQVEMLGRPIVDKPFGPAELREAVAQVRRLREPEVQASGSST